MRELVPHRPRGIGRRVRAVGRALAACALAAAVGLAGVAPAGADHAWGNYHWARTSNPFTLRLGDNLSSQWDPYLAEASSDWSRSAVLDTTVVPGNTTGRLCRPTTGRIEVCNAAYGKNGWLGLAQIWISGTHITKATAKLNDSYFNAAPYTAPAWRRLVLCQEVAHGFGLDHQDETFTNPNLGSCMDYTGDPDGPPSNEHPNQHDYDQLAAIYGHTDATSTAPQTQTPSPFAALRDSLADLDDPRSWGRAVAHYRDGRPRAYQRDLGAGERVVTFVTWVPGARQAGGRT